MSIYIPADREPVYRKYGLEDALEDVVFQPGERVDLRDRPDSFGHLVLMVWTAGEGGVDINVGGVEVPVHGAPSEAFDHPFPLIHQRLGEGALNYLTQAQSPVAEAA